MLALYSSDENHFISWRTIYGPTSCFFFTLNTLMYTVIICTHIYLYIHTHSFPELLKKQYIYLTCIYLLLDRTMIAYLFHTLFMNINRTEIQHMVHISTNARGKINFQPTFMHSFIIKRACNNIWSHLMKVSLKTCIRSFYKKNSVTCYYLIYCTTHFKNIIILLAFYMVRSSKYFDKKGLILNVYNRIWIEILPLHYN